MKPSQTLWSLGVDPGFGETGLVLRRSDHKDEVMAFATFQEHSTKLPGFVRATALADAVCDKVNEWCSYFGISRLEVCIEQPIFNRNNRFSSVTTFLIQIRLYNSIETGLAMIVAPFLDEMHLTEAIPSSTKKAATGDGSADKGAIVKASPVDKSWDGLDTDGPLEAVADAWAHSLCAKTQTINLTTTTMPVVMPHKEWKAKWSQS